MSRSIFLGLGKSNQGLASVVPGEKRALVETAEGFVDIFDFSKGQFAKVDSIKGTFDSYDFSRESFDQAFLSPGIDPRRPFMKIVGAKEKRELDFVMERFQGRTIVITGTDGKSTMTVQCGEVMRRAFSDSKVFVGGNLGTPMSEALNAAYDWAVLEVSSFQAERLKIAQPDYGILLNLAPDHLDRYDDLQSYYAAKWSLISRSKFQFYPVELHRPLPVKASEAKYTNEEEVSALVRKVMTVILMRENVVASDDLFKGLPTLPHRQEVWKDQRDAFFVNDSKATTVHATAYALKHLSGRFGRLHLILGGRHKGDDFSVLLPLLRKTDSVYVVGEARAVIQEQMNQRGEQFSSLAECLAKTLTRVQPSEALVLSPACSSYDEFNNFEERGTFFLKEVEKVRGSLVRQS